MPNDIVMLFGAGASYGATHVRPSAPPLMDSLYTALATLSPKQWGVESPFAPHEDAFTKDFERTFGEVVLNPPFEWPSLNILEVQIPVAAYFSQFILETGGLDCYSRVLSALNAAGKISNCFFSSLNYDCLLEQAAVQVGIAVDYSCNHENSIRIAKLHGSCNLITDAATQNIRAQLATRGTHVELHADFINPTANLRERVEAKIGGHQPAHFPVMSQISPRKEHFVSPARIEEIRNQWRKAVSTAKTTGIVGVKYNPNDSHIVQPIMESRASVIYIGDDASARSWKAEHVGQTFEDGLNRLVERLIR
jgi:hypothetical protein